MWLRMSMSSPPARDGCGERNHLRLIPPLFLPHLKSSLVTPRAKFRRAERRCRLTHELSSFGNKLFCEGHVLHGARHVVR